MISDDWFRLGGTSSSSSSLFHIFAFVRRCSVDDGSVAEQMPPQRDVGTNQATAVEAELAQRQELARRVGQARERAHANEDERRSVLAGCGGQQ